MTKCSAVKKEKTLILSPKRIKKFVQLAVILDLLSQFGVAFLFLGCILARISRAEISEDSLAWHGMAYHVRWSPSLKPRSTGLFSIGEVS